MMRRIVLAMLAVSVVLAGCSSDGEDRSAGCAEAKEYLRRQTGAAQVDRNDLTEMTQWRDAYVKAEAALAKAAPSDVAEALDIIDRANPDSLEIETQEALADSYDTLNEWMADDCGLRVPT